MRCRPNGSPYWFTPPRLNVAMQPSVIPCTRCRYLSEVESSLLSAKVVALHTTQIASTVAAPTGAGNCAVQIRPSGATISAGDNAPWFHCMS